MILSIIFLIFICTYIRPLKSNIPLILTCNTFLTEIILSIVVIEICSRTISGVLNNTVSIDGIYCRVRAYFFNVSASSVMYSFVVKALFRLVRVVFYQKRALRTLRVFTIVMIIKWIFICFINLIFFPLNDFEYVPSEYRCLIIYSNFRGSLMILLFTYTIPTNLLFTIYFFIIRYVRQTNHAMQNRQLTRRRDVIVLKRIILFFIVLQVFSIPLAVIWLVYIITGYLLPSIYQLQHLTMAFSQIFITIVIAFDTPQIKQKFRRQPRQIYPVLRMRFQRHNTIDRIQVQRF